MGRFPVPHLESLTALPPPTENHWFEPIHACLERTPELSTSLLLLVLGAPVRRLQVTVSAMPPGVPVPGDVQGPESPSLPAACPVGMKAAVSKPSETYFPKQVHRCGARHAPSLEPEG